MAWHSFITLTYYPTASYNLFNQFSITGHLDFFFLFLMQLVEKIFFKLLEEFHKAEEAKMDCPSWKTHTHTHTQPQPFWHSRYRRKEGMLGRIWVSEGLRLGRNLHVRGKQVSKKFPRTFKTKTICNLILAIYCAMLRHNFLLWPTVFGQRL